MIRMGANEPPDILALENPKIPLKQTRKVENGLNIYKKKNKNTKKHVENTKNTGKDKKNIYRNYH
jgi:hypothetical protein